MVENWVEVLRTCNLPRERRMDGVSKWLLVTRACVFSMTAISVGIGGLLAALTAEGDFPVGRFLVVLLGALLAHASNNMVNDLYDVWNGVDTAGYPRATYAPHPLLDGLVTQRELIAAIAVANLADLAIALWLVTLVGWPVLALGAVGLAISVFYVAPPLKLKHRGLGEPAIFLIWGPLLVGGTYYALAGTLGWEVIACSVPYGLGVTAVLMGKHMDKADLDRAKGVRSLPVILGPARSGRATQLLVWAYYLGIAGLVGARLLPWPVLVALVSLPQATRFLRTLGEPPPAAPEEAFARARDVMPRDLAARHDPGAPGGAYPLWPLWYVAWGVWWVRLAGGLFVLGLAASLFLV